MALAIEPAEGLASLSAHFAERAAQLRPSVVSIHSGGRGRAAPRSGAGVVWQADGLIVTNAHVVQAPRSQVVLADGRDFEATLVAQDPALDLAALRVRASGLPAAPVGDSSALRVGQLVFAIGHPLGEAHAIAWGVVSAPVHGLEDTGPHGWGMGRGIVQADLRLFPGNSGGPLADAQGRVVGINHMVQPPRLALAVSSATVASFLARLVGPRLGVRVRTVSLPPPLVDRLSLPGERALMVVEVAADQAAARAGLLPGDVLLAAGDRWLDRPDALATALQAGGGASAGVQLHLVRGGSVREVHVEPRSQG